MCETRTLQCEIWPVHLTAIPVTTLTPKNCGGINQLYNRCVDKRTEHSDLTIRTGEGRLKLSYQVAFTDCRGVRRL
jgi:hypothetical protein